jgi:hypothetical protein
VSTGVAGRRGDSANIAGAPSIDDVGVLHHRSAELAVDIDRLAAQFGFAIAGLTSDFIK